MLIQEAVQLFNQPLREFRLNRKRLSFGPRRLQLRDPFCLCFAYERSQLPQIHPMELRQIAEQQGAGRGGADHLLQEKTMAQYAEYRFGNKPPIIYAELGVLPEKTPKYRVSGMLQRKHGAERGGSHLQVGRGEAHR